MNWVTRTQPVKVGDKIAYTAAFLRGTGQYTGDVPQAKGIVLALVPLGETVLAEIAWDTPDLPRRVHVANICRVNSIAY